jgi:2-amino-4-hydroxy-6-hydroxymethyldihydropteridine diphosphokinase
VKTVYLSLGSNIGDREENLRKAIESLAAVDVRVLRESPIYETEPVGLADQRWFLNMVVETETALFPLQLLTRTAKIERDLGRVRTLKNGPRTIDIDILLFAKAAMRTARLTIPHSRMHERRFVLVPLADLAPELRHPVTHKTVRQMLDAAPPEKLRRVTP